MKLQTYVIIILLAGSAFLGYENYLLKKGSDNPATLQSYLTQIQEMSKTVADLQLSCKK